jgi:stage V sporulation protein AD
MGFKILHRGKNCEFSSDTLIAEPEPAELKPSFHNSGQGSFFKKHTAAKSAAQKSRSGRTVFFESPPVIAAGASVVSEREANGPLGEYFDSVESDPKMGEKCFENAEIKMMTASVERAAQNAGLALDDINLLVAGDLLNQLTTSGYAARELGLPYLGVYGACSTFTESLLIGAAMLNTGGFKTAVCAAASHFATAERQFRFPLEYGGQRPPYAQWTVTGAGATVLTAPDFTGGVKRGGGSFSPRITGAVAGRAIDYGIKDLSNMGAAMAPAAADTLSALFKDTGASPDDFDLILTGDLGKLGSDILRDLMRERGCELGRNYKDCGSIMYDITQKSYQGGSGAGCSAAVFNSYILKKLREGVYNRVAFMATGAIMSTQSCYQGESIPGIAHLVIIENLGGN